MFRSRGFTVPIVLVFTMIFLTLPVFFWFIFNNNSAESVKGTSVEKTANVLTLKIVSPSGTWEVQQFLCKDKQDCTNDLLSGKRYATVSGGKTSAHFVTLAQPTNTDGYTYIKLVAKAAWGSNSAKFKVGNSDLLSTFQAEKVSLTDNKQVYEVVLFPLNIFSGGTDFSKTIDFVEN